MTHGSARPLEPIRRPAGARLPARARPVSIGSPRDPPLPCSAMERGQILFEEHGRRRRRRALAGRPEGDHDGWFCVRTDPFPCPADGCTFVAEFMTAAHLILVWQELDDPNLLRHAARARDVGRNPRVTGYRSEYGPSASYYAWVAAGPAGARRQDALIPEHVRRVRAVLARGRGGADDPRRRDATSRSPAVDRILRGVEGLALPGPSEDGALRLGVRDEHRRLRIVAEVDEALPALRRAAAAAAAREGLAIAAAATASVRASPRASRSSRRSATSASSATAASRCGGRASRACTSTSGCRPPRTAGAASRRSCPWLPVVLALSANSPWFAGELTGMASNRAPVLAELPRARRAAGVRVVRGVGGVGRAARRARRDAGLHAHLVGRPAASEARHARGAHPRPADRRAALGRVRRARAGDVRDGARRTACPARRAARRPRPRRLRAEPLGGGALRARAPSCIHPDGPSVGRRDRARRRAARARAAGGTSARRRGRARRGSTRRAARPTCSSTHVASQARRGSRPPLARLTMAVVDRDDPGQRHPLRALRDAPREDARRRRGARVREREPDGPGAARLRRRAHHAGCAPRADGSRRLPRARVLSLAGSSSRRARAPPGRNVAVSTGRAPVGASVRVIGLGHSDGRRRRLDDP